MSQQTRLRQERVLVAEGAMVQEDTTDAADAQLTTTVYRKQRKLH